MSKKIDDAGRVYKTFPGVGVDVERNEQVSWEIPSFARPAPGTRLDEFEIIIIKPFGRDQTFDENVKFRVYP